MADTRKDKRAPVSLKVRFKSATVDEFIEQYAHDISRGGVFIKSKQPMPVGTLLKFEVQLKDESPLIHGVGRVVWKREAGAGATDDAPAGMGIKFIRMDPECRTVVDRIVNQRGESPGQYESGSEGEERPPAAAAAGPAAAPAPAPVPASVASAAVGPPSSKSRHKETIPFFPIAGPTEAELPRPEDRTQVRHASEFLASALAEAGSDESAREAERKAAEARKRSEEIEQERAAQRQRELDTEHAKAAAERDKNEASERAKSEPPKKSSELEDAPRRASGSGRPGSGRPGSGRPGSGRSVSGTADTELAAPQQKKSVPPRDGESERPAAAARAAKSDPLDAEIVPRNRKSEKRGSSSPPSGRAGEKKSPLVVRTVSTRGVSEPPPPLPEEPRSYALPVAAAVVAVLGIGAWMWAQSGAPPDDELVATTGTDTATAPDVAPETEPGLGAAEVAPTGDLGTPVEPDPMEGEGEGAAQGEGVGEGAAAPEAAEPGEPGGAATAGTTTASPAAGAPTEGTATPTTTGAAPAAPAMAHFRIDSSPTGAAIVIGGVEHGPAPVEVDLEVGQAAAIAARAPGYREATQTVTPSRTQRPVRITLQPLPYFVEVTTTPPGVRVRAGGGTATTSADAPSRISIATPPRTAVQVVGTRSGYVDATQSVPATEFRERNGEMVATVSLALTERPAAPATPRVPRRPREPAEGSSEGGGEGGATAPPAGEGGSTPPAETPPPRPRPDPEPEEAPPDNPF